MAEPPILLYDNGCGVCHWAVQFVLKNDTRGRIMFAPLDSRVGHDLRARYQVPADIDSVVLIDRGRAALRSDAALDVVREIGGFWRILTLFAVLPRGVRDFLYDTIARRRERISARFRLTCAPPTAAERSRFLA